MFSLTEWAYRWNVPAAALKELAGVPALDPIEIPLPATSEAAVQAAVRLEAARHGIRAWRNNVGAGKLQNGSFLRWGLANESSALNARLKSADLIGWRSHLIKPDEVGKLVAIFWSREVKRSSWRYTDTPEEQAQLRWHSMVLAAGGDSAIVNSTGSIK